MSAGIGLYVKLETVRRDIRGGIRGLGEIWRFLLVLLGGTVIVGVSSLGFSDAAD